MSRRSFTNFNEHDETELRIYRLYHNIAPRREAPAGIPVRSVNHDIQNVLADCRCNFIRREVRHSLHDQIVRQDRVRQQLWARGCMRLFLQC